METTRNDDNDLEVYFDFGVVPEVVGTGEEGEDDEGMAMEGGRG